MDRKRFFWTGLSSAVAAGFVWWLLTEQDNQAHAPTVPSGTENERLNALIPEVRAKVVALRNILAGKGIDTFIGSTIRTEAEGAKNYAEGRSATTQSWHLLGRAVDLYVQKNGRVIYSPKDALTEYQTLGAEAKKLGFRWLGTGTICSATGKCFTDPAHIEYRNGMTFAQAAAKAGMAKDKAA